MNIVFRVDASVQMGTGHVMRCLALASELKAHGANVSFICRTLEGHLCELIEREGYQVFRLPQAQNNEYIEKLTSHSHWLEVNWRTDAEQTIQIIKDIQTVDWLIIDHYGIEKHWEKLVRPYVKKIMVIDDLADREHDCDLLLDQNYYENLNERYKKLVGEKCKTMLGPKYVLLRKEFRNARKKLRNRHGKLNRILVFMGGSDPENITAKVLHALINANFKVVVDVVVGASNIHKNVIKEFCSKVPYIHFHCQVKNMAELMLKADLAIGSGGTTTWERCYLGLPSLVITIAENQRKIVEALDKAGVLIHLGDKDIVSGQQIISTIERLDSSTLRRMSTKALDLMGHGFGVEEVVKELLFR